MKGVELLASLIAILIMLGITSLLSGIIIFVLNAANQPTSSRINYEMYLSPIYPPIKYEAMLLSYLESTDSSGYQIKKILAYAAYQKNITNVFVEGREITSLSTSSKQILDNWIERDGYILILNVGGNPYVISENKRAIQNLPDSRLTIRRISIPLYIDRYSFKNDKKADLPLNVTLDFYVQ